MRAWILRILRSRGAKRQCPLGRFSLPPRLASNRSGAGGGCGRSVRKVVHEDIHGGPRSRRGLPDRQRAAGGHRAARRLAAAVFRRPVHRFGEHRGAFGDRGLRDKVVYATKVGYDIYDAAAQASRRGQRELPQRFDSAYLRSAVDRYCDDFEKLLKKWAFRFSLMQERMLI